MTFPNRVCWRFLWRTRIWGQPSGSFNVALYSSLEIALAETSSTSSPKMHFFRDVYIFTQHAFFSWCLRLHRTCIFFVTFTSSLNMHFFVMFTSSPKLHFFRDVYVFIQHAFFRNVYINVVDFLLCSKSEYSAFFFVVSFRNTIFFKYVLSSQFNVFMC